MLFFLLFMFLLLLFMLFFLLFMFLLLLFMLFFLLFMFLLLFISTIITWFFSIVILRDRWDIIRISTVNVQLIPQSINIIWLLELRCICTDGLHHIFKNKL